VTEGRTVGRVRILALFVVVMFVALSARLSAVGVRGYDKALDRVRRVVEDELGLRSADASLADEAVSGAGGTPGGVSSKLATRSVRECIPQPAKALPLPMLANSG
jgi:hypothetical protein